MAADEELLVYSLLTYILYAYLYAPIHSVAADEELLVYSLLTYILYAYLYAPIHSVAADLNC